jgi:hypothetical protein
MPHIRVHDPHDNAGPSIPGLSKDDVPAQEELAAFDQLGPLVRTVISEMMCVPWSSHKTLQAIKEESCADPLNPGVDRDVAEMLLRANADIIAEIRLARALVINFKTTKARYHDQM